VVAVASGESRRADVVAFVRQRFGSAPITVYFDRSGRSQAAFDAPYHPEYRFTTRAGRLTARAPAGFPLG
jgi:hypothetical protein